MNRGYEQGRDASGDPQIVHSIHSSKSGSSVRDVSTSGSDPSDLVGPGERDACSHDGDSSPASVHFRHFTDSGRCRAVRAVLHDASGFTRISCVYGRSSRIVDGEARGEVDASGVDGRNMMLAIKPGFRGRVSRCARTVGEQPPGGISASFVVGSMPAASSKGVIGPSLQTAVLHSYARQLLSRFLT